MILQRHQLGSQNDFRKRRPNSKLVSYINPPFHHNLFYQNRHTEVYDLQDRYKEQIKDREEIILQHTTTNAEYSKKLVELENKI